VSVELIAAILGSGALGAVAAAAANYIGSRSAVQVDRFEAIVAALNARIDDLQREVDHVAEKLDAEQHQHDNTRKRLRAALRHIRAMLAWLGTDHQDAPPDVPPELLDDL